MSSEQSPDLPLTPVTIPRRRFPYRRIAALLFLSATVLWLLASFVVGYRLTHRATPPFPEPVPECAWGTFQPLRLKTADGQELGAWTLPGKENRPIILILHGNGGSRTTCLPQAEFLARQGHGLLMVTQRAHGDSTGETLGLGSPGAYDLLAAVEWIEQHHPQRPIVIWGQSLGASAILYAAGKLSTRAKGYLLECPFQDLEHAVRYRTDYYLPVPLNGIAYAGLRVVAPVMIGDIRTVAPRDQAQFIPETIPVMFLVGDRDRRAPLADTQAIATQIKSPVEIVRFENGDHLELLASDPQKYRESTLKFIERCLRHRSE
ncbi:MAG: alpha/beta fold hydrolase [Planctomycetales bacterium]